MWRECCECEHNLHADEYTSNQWAKGVGRSKCMTCVDRSMQSAQCHICLNWYSGDNSLKQHMKTHPDCEKCGKILPSNDELMRHMDEYHPSCAVCNRTFQSPNALMQHSKTHVAKTVSCPICGNKKFRNAANAVAHVESGYCSGCRGSELAKSSIYDYVSSRAPTLCVPMIENGYTSRSVPDHPYRCTKCSKTFSRLSSQMNHENDVHGDNRKLQQIGW